jgi:hypothetical protein
MPLGERRSHKPAASIACGSAPVASTTQRARSSCTVSPAFSRAPATRPPSEQRRLEAQRRQAARAGALRAAAQHVVEHAARQHGQRARHVDHAAARADAAHVLHRFGHRHHLVEHAEAAQRGVGVGDQPVAADLVAREDMLVDENDIAPGLGQPLRAGTAGGAGADDEDVAGRGRGEGRHRGAVRSEARDCRQRPPCSAAA